MLAVKSSSHRSHMLFLSAGANYSNHLLRQRRVLLHRLRMWLMLLSGNPHAGHALLLPGKALAPARNLPKSLAFIGSTVNSRYRWRWSLGGVCGYHFKSMLAATATFRIAASVWRNLP